MNCLARRSVFDSDVYLTDFRKYYTIIFKTFVRDAELQSFDVFVYNLLGFTKTKTNILK